MNRKTAKASKAAALGVTIGTQVPFTFVDTGTGTLATGTMLTVINNISGNPARFSGRKTVLCEYEMKGMHVDLARRSARAEPGLTWREFDHETQAFGLASTGGQISTVCTPRWKTIHP